MSSAVSRRVASRASFDLGGQHFSLTLLAAAILLHAFASATSITTTTAEEVGFGAVFVTALGIVILGLRGDRRVRVPVVGLLWFTYMTLELLQILDSTPDSPSAALTDAAVMVLPVIMLVAIQVLQPARWQLNVFMYWLIAGSAASSVFAWFISPSGLRFEAPNMLAIVGAWMMLASGGDQTRAQSEQTLLERRRPEVGLLLTALLAPLILASRSRTALGIWFAAGVIASVIQARRSAKHPTGQILLIGVVGLVALLLMANDSERLETFAREVQHQARLDSLLDATGDTSLESRIKEVADVQATFELNARGLDRVVGLGHGATYLPQRSNIAGNINPLTGRVHSIHATPFMIHFRYGWLGVGVFVAAVLGILRVAWIGMKRHDFLAYCVGLLAFAYPADLLIRNSFVDPGLAITVALAVWAGHQSIPATESKDLGLHAVA